LDKEPNIEELKFNLDEYITGSESRVGNIFSPENFMSKNRVD
jgi:hypothetical protein